MKKGCVYTTMVYAVSFCLYGPENPKYYQGLLENIKLIQEHFSGWVTYLYIGIDVPARYLQKLQQYPNIRIRTTGITGPKTMIHRFFAIDEPDVDVMFVRDADSRIHWRDRWAMCDFLANTEFVAHGIRDHPKHGVLMLGGLWGLRKTSGINIHEAYEQYTQNEVNYGCGYDQSFLGECIYPKVKSRLLTHVSDLNLTFQGETCKLFPFPRSPQLYCGQVETNAPLAFLRRGQIR